MTEQEINYKLIAERLWNILDDIDTANDHYKPDMNNYFASYVDVKIRDRFQYATDNDNTGLKFNKDIPILENLDPMTRWFKEAWEIEKDLRVKITNKPSVILIKK